MKKKNIDGTIWLVFILDFLVRVGGDVGAAGGGGVI